MIVITVTHRTRDEKGRRLGHVGIVTERTKESIAKNGGNKWASYALPTADGVEISQQPQRFETYTTEEEAKAHAEYAAKKG